ncbi:MAG: hypothetical protein EXR95_11080, partial [Gemmatimonadetes bacterium]|nr:hypothetical protein [Gemmatimonadota bacterium]
MGWLAIRGLGRQSAATIAADTAAPASPNPAVVALEPAAAAPEPATPAGPLAVLPAEPASRQALYDSLFAARSPVFEQQLAAVGTETSERAVQRAIAAWKDGQVDAQDADLIHSALLQHVLKETDPRIEVDGQVLRNPCRGRSCSALLNVWENQQAKYGLGPVPENAPTDAPRAAAGGGRARARVGPRRESQRRGA